MQACTQQTADRYLSMNTFIYFSSFEISPKISLTSDCLKVSTSWVLNDWLWTPYFPPRFRPLHILLILLILFSKRFKNDIFELQPLNFEYLNFLSSARLFELSLLKF